VADPAPDEIDSQVRAAAFRFLDAQTRMLGDRLPYSLLLRGFDFRGQRVPLVGPQGIFKPAVLDRIPLTIMTAPPVPNQPRPYDDGLRPDGTLHYKYRGTDPDHHENRRLREAMAGHVPLIYLHGIEKGVYLAAWPVYVVADDPFFLAFTVDLDGRSLSVSPSESVADKDLPRRYAEVTVLRRIHQEEFRRRVLRAYRESCALCRLRHRELLDAAHITPDSDPRGDAAVSNALALCKLHHAAFDQQLIGVRPDLVVEVRPDVLAESDGPMLLHGLQQMHGLKLVVPKDAKQRPDPERLEARYQLFREAS